MVEAGRARAPLPAPEAVRGERLANRTHRKILVADGRVGLTGGVGIAEEWTGDAQDPDHWRDTHVRVEGPRRARPVRRVRGELARGHRRGARRPGATCPDLPERDDGGGPMMVVRSSAGVGDTNVEALYYLAIAAARETLDITAAYFVPRPAFTEALQDAAERGVRMRVLVPGPTSTSRRCGSPGAPPTTTLLAAGVRSTSTSRRCCTRRP